MKYKKFRAKLQAVLQDFYGRDAEVVILKLIKSHGKTEYGIMIRGAQEPVGTTPVICLKKFYRQYRGGSAFEKCVGKIIELRRNGEYDNG